MTADESYAILCNHAQNQENIPQTDEVTSQVRECMITLVLNGWYVEGEPEEQSRDRSLIRFRDNPYMEKTKGGYIEWKRKSGMVCCVFTSGKSATPVSTHHKYICLLNQL